MLSVWLLTGNYIHRIEIPVGKVEENSETLSISISFDLSYMGVVLQCRVGFIKITKPA